MQDPKPTTPPEAQGILDDIAKMVSSIDRSFTKFDDVAEMLGWGFAIGVGALCVIALCLVILVGMKASERTSRGATTHGRSLSLRPRR